MDPLVLRKEVLPPRQAPCGSAEPVELCELATAEKHLRSSITRSIWTMILLTGTATATARLLGMFL